MYKKAKLAGFFPIDQLSGTLQFLPLPPLSSHRQDRTKEIKDDLDPSSGSR